MVTRLKLKTIAYRITSACTIQRRWRVAYGEQISGVTISEIRREIQSIVSERNDVQCYGFGSFFAGSPYFNDIDTLLIIPDDDQILKTVEYYLDVFKSLGLRLDVTFDLTMLTPVEFAGAPLRDMHTLHRIY